MLFSEGSETLEGEGSDFGASEGTRFVFGVPGPEFESSMNTVSGLSPLVDLCGGSDKPLNKGHLWGPKRWSLRNSKEGPYD